MFLDLAVRSLRNAIHGGGIVDPDDFDVPFEALIDKIIRRLSSGEQRALLLACLFPRFSPSLIVASSDGTVLEADVLRLLQHDLAARQPWPVFSLKVHDALSAAVRALPVESGGLTPNDWRQAAARGLRALELEAGE